MRGDHHDTGVHAMNRPVKILAGVVAAAATATLMWMPTVVLAGITFNVLD
jgi:hypothetical protein